MNERLYRHESDGGSPTWGGVGRVWRRAIQHLQLTQNCWDTASGLAPTRHPLSTYDSHQAKSTLVA